MRVLLIFAAVCAGCVVVPDPSGPQPDMSADLVEGDTSVDVDTSPPVPVAKFPSIAFAGTAACAVDNTGRVACWGNNNSSIAANVLVTDPRAPAYRDDIVGFQHLDGGLSHMCGIVGDTVKCWGDNAAQQLGADSDTSGAPMEVDVSAISTGRPVSVSAGSVSSCAVFEDGRAACWGRNLEYGIAPDEPNIGPLSPTAVQGDFKAVSTGNGYTCLIGANNRTSCWGHNGDRRAVPSNTAAVVPSLTEILNRLFTAIDTGEFTCAVVAGNVQCWGENKNGRLGVPESTNLNTIEFDGDGATDVVVGVNHACALRASGTVTCWGEWQAGLAANPTDFAASDRAEFLAVGAGDRVTCASTSDHLECWGSNQDGVAGQFDSAGIPLPDSVDVPTSVELTP